MKQQPKLVQYNNGIYQGYLDSQAKKKGNGIFLYDDSTMFIGEWKNDLYHGFGLILLPYGGYFRGQFEKHNIENIGATVTAEEIFVGNYRNSILQGDAVSYRSGVWSQFSYYYGQKKECKQHVPLRHVSYKEIFNQIKTFTFDFGLIDGLGVKVDDKTIKIGEFKMGVLDGIGRHISENGDIQDGYFKGGVLHSGFRFDRQENKFQQIQLILNGEEIQTQLILKGIGFPSKLIRNFREEFHRQAKNYCDETQEKPLFHQHFIEVSQKSQWMPIFNYMKMQLELTHNYPSLAEMSLGQLPIYNENYVSVLDEGEVHIPRLSYQKESDHLERSSKLQILNVEFLKKFESLQVFDPLPTYEINDTRDITQRTKKRIFD